MGRVWLRARSACPPPFPVPVCGVGVRARPGSRLCPALLGWVVGVCFLRFFFLVWLCGVGCWVSLSRALWPLSPHPLSFGLRCWLFFFFFFLVVCGCMFRCPFSRWAAVPGLVLPVLAGWYPCASWGSRVRCLLGGRFGRLLWCWRAVWWLWAVFAPPPPRPPPLFFLGGGAARSSLCLPWAGARIGPHSVWSSGLLLACSGRVPCSGPMGRVGYVHVGLGALSCVWL